MFACADAPQIPLLPDKRGFAANLNDSAAQDSKLIWREGSLSFLLGPNSCLGAPLRKRQLPYQAVSKLLLMMCNLAALPPSCLCLQGAMLCLQGEQHHAAD